MTALFSARWYRVAGLKPRLSAQLQLRRQRLRGENWYVLADPLRGRSVRLNAAAYAIAGRLDGRRSVQQLWDRSLQHAPDAATQDEVIDLLAQLREAALVQFDRAADFDLLLPHLDQVARPRGGNSLLAWRLPLGNPSALLRHLQPLERVLFSRMALLVWAAALVLLLVLLLQHAPSLWAHGRLWLDTPRFALLAVVLYVPIKLLHELAHGLAVLRWGGQVRQAGVTLMLLLPVPFVDASAASAFVARRHRIAVSAAGIMAELALAALAMPLWLWLGEGLARDAAFMTLVIAGVSTLLFNGNPLQRLDGYYIFTDAADLPNLGPRSRQWWLDLLRRRLLGVRGGERMAVARGERPWLAVYAPLAWCYGLVIAALAVLWLGQLSLVLGLSCAVLLAWQMLLRPVARLLAQLRRAALAQHATTRRWRWLASGAAVATGLLLLLPWPQRTVVQGVVWPPDQAQLRADEAGFVDQVLARDGQVVRIGEVVLQLSNAQLQSTHTRQQERMKALEITLFNALPAGGADTGDAHAELAAAQVELQRLDERVAALALRAGTNGRLAIPTVADLPGQFVRQGSLVGQVLTDAAPTVRVALPEAEAGNLRQLQGRVSVRLAASPGTARAAVLARDSGGAVPQLPSAALSQRHGGAVATDPLDPQDLRPVQPVVLLDVQLAAPIGAGDARIGERAWVRFDAGYTPLGLHWVRNLRQQVLRRFNPQF